jgi:hypothetical protein
MTTIDWSRPIVTNAGKPAKVDKGPDSTGDYRVRADFQDGTDTDWFDWFNANGFWPGQEAPYIRNATPAEILAHPDVWPEWQEWARSIVEGPQMGVDMLRPLRGGPSVDDFLAKVPKPITHAAMLAAVERLPEHLDGPAAIADALCNALGVDVPVKRAAWEVAWGAWRFPGWTFAERHAWQAAWAACEAHHGITGQGQQ